MADRSMIERLTPYFAQREPWEPALDPSALGDPREYDGLGAYVALLQRGEPSDQVFALLSETVKAAITGLDPDRPPGDPLIASSVPPLPAAARLTAAQEREAEEAGRWLGDYVDFASRASPLTPRAFHIAGGLFAGSLAIARRLHLRVSTTTIYPNVYVLFVGHSTLPRKTTAMGVLRGLLRAAEMGPFLLADRQTPEALVLDMGLHVPPSFDQWPSAERERWLQERRLAAQRGWLLEEASHLLDSFNRDYSAGLLPLVLDLFDAADEGARRNTVSRGSESVRQPYLSIFGATTYGALQVHLAREAHWSNGLWARFALVADDTLGQWQFWPPPMEYPGDLVGRLHCLSHELLPLPKVTLTSRPPSDGGGDQPSCSKEAVLESLLVSHGVIVDGAAWRQWEAYARAVSFDLLRERSIGLAERLFASYGRLGTTLIKVAIVLAALDAEELPVRVAARHVCRAQQIVETWRASLHHVFERTQEIQQGSQEDQLQQRVLARLAARGTNWTSRRELQRLLHVRLEELAPVLNALVSDGAIEVLPSNEPGAATVQYRHAAAP